eukprot:2565639-Prymnesium_polylepis.1
METLADVRGRRALRPLLGLHRRARVVLEVADACLGAAESLLLELEVPQLRRAEREVRPYGARVHTRERATRGRGACGVLAVCGESPKRQAAGVRRRAAARGVRRGTGAGYGVR